MAITQVISTIPQAGHRGDDTREAFVAKQEDFQDALTNTFVGQINTFTSQANTLQNEVNSKANAVESNLALSASNASNAGNSASVALEYAEIAIQKAEEIEGYVVPIGASYSISQIDEKLEVVEDKETKFTNFIADIELGIIPLISDDTFESALDLKANVTDMTTALDLKANVTDMTTALDLKANLASPAFTDTPTAPTPVAEDNSTKLATTEFVTNRLASEVLYCATNRGIGWETFGAITKHGFAGAFTANNGFTIVSGAGNLVSGNYIRIPKTGLYLVQTKCYFGGASLQRIHTQVRTSISDVTEAQLHFTQTEAGSDFLEQSSFNQLIEGNLIFFSIWASDVELYTVNQHSEIQLAYLGAI